MLIVTLLFIDILHFNTVANYRRWESSIYGNIEDRNRFFKVSTSDNGKIFKLFDFIILLRTVNAYLETSGTHKHRIILTNNFNLVL